MSLQAIQHLFSSVARQAVCLGQVSYCPMTSKRGRAWARNFVARRRGAIGGS